jgi:hypothetical protein
MRSREGLPFAHPGCPVTGKKAGKFVDTGKIFVLAGKRWPLLIHESGAAILGRHVGMLDREDVAALNAELITLRHKVSSLELELMEADAAIDGTEALVRQGMRVTRPPGRPKKSTIKE